MNPHILHKILVNLLEKEIRPSGFVSHLGNSKTCKLIYKQWYSWWHLPWAFHFQLSSFPLRQHSTGLIFARNWLLQVLIIAPYATAAVLASVGIRVNYLRQFTLLFHGSCNGSVQRTLRIWWRCLNQSSQENVPRWWCFINRYIFLIAYPSGHAVYGVGLRLLACWNCGFKSRRGHGCLSLVSAVYSQVEVSASGWSVVQRSPTVCGVSECDREASIVRRPWPTRVCRAKKKKYIYIFGISIEVMQCTSSAGF